EPLDAVPPAIRKTSYRLVAACSSAFVRTRARDSKLSAKRRNLRRSQLFIVIPNEAHKEGTA
ncbi:MAG: hypothetical protein DME76_19660, partial [Verrucomicrobia bacterium]